MPRYLLLLHGDKDSEDGKMPSKDILEQMHAYNSEIISAGALLGGEGLHATSKAARVSFPPPDPANPTQPGSKSDITVTNGPWEYSMGNLSGRFVGFGSSRPRIWTKRSGGLRRVLWPGRM